MECEAGYTALRCRTLTIHLSLRCNTNPFSNIDRILSLPRKMRALQQPFENTSAVYINDLRRSTGTEEGIFVFICNYSSTFNFNASTKSIHLSC